MAMVNSFEQPGTTITLTPTADLLTSRYCFASVGSTSQLVITGAGAKAVGVLQLPAIAKEPSPVMVTGISYIVIGATLTPGQEVEADASGKAIPLASGKSNGVCIVGGPAGAIGTILIK